MGKFLWIVAVGVPVSTMVCMVHALIRRRLDLARGGVPVLAVTLLFGLLLIGLFK